MIARQEQFSNSPNAPTANKGKVEINLGKTSQTNEVPTLLRWRLRQEDYKLKTFFVLLIVLERVSYYIVLADLPTLDIHLPLFLCWN